MVARMSFQQSGNGEGKIDITVTDLRGVVRAHAAHPPANPEDYPRGLPIALTRAVNEFFDKRPHPRLQCVVPIVWQGSPLRSSHALFVADCEVLCDPVPGKSDASGPVQAADP